MITLFRTPAIHAHDHDRIQYEFFVNNRPLSGEYAHLTQPPPPPGHPPYELMNRLHAAALADFYRAQHPLVRMTQQAFFGTAGHSRAPAAACWAWPAPALHRV